MKNLFLFLFILFLFCTTSWAQIAINTDGSTPDPSAMLDVKATDRGLLIPRISTTDRDKIPSPSSGLMIYNTTTNQLNFYNGCFWFEIESSFISSTIGSISIKGGVSINVSPDVSPENSAMLDINNASRGLLLPRTTPEFIASPATGLIIYNTTTNCLNYYDGGRWLTISAISTGITSTVGTQNNIGVGINTKNSSPNNSAILDVDAIDKGVLIPRLNNQQRDALLPANGLIIYDISNNKIEFFNSSAWNQLTVKSEFPTVSTKACSNITATKALSGGTITNDGGEAIIARGICWNTKGNPAIGDSITSDTIGVGNFSSQMKGLIGNTTYFVRAYAIFEKGKTIYGNEVSFKTPPFNLFCIYGTDSVTLKIEDFKNKGGIEWQESMDTIHWTSVPGALDDIYQFSPTQTKYYRAMVKTSISESKPSVITLVKLDVLFNYDKVLKNGSTVAWYDLSDLSTIKKDGSNKITRINDKLGSGNDLIKQIGVCTPPTWIDNTALFDGKRNALMTNPFQYNQPVTIYLVIKQITWANNMYILDGYNGDECNLRQYGESSPQLTVNAGLNSNNVTAPLNEWMILRIKFDGANSKFTLNNRLPSRGDFGTKTLNGITFGKRGGADYNNLYSNFQLAEAIFRINDSATTESVIYNALNAKYNIRKPDTMFKNGKLVITVDDGNVYSYGGIYPRLLNQGVKGTFYVIPNLTGTGTYATWDNLIEMYNNGMDIECHTNTHRWLTKLTEADILAEYEAVNNAFIIHGLPVPNHTAYPAGEYNLNIKTWTGSKRLTARTVDNTANDIYINKTVDKLALKTEALDNANVTRVDIIKAKLDVIQYRHEALILYCHGATLSGGTESISYSALDEIINYAKSKGIDIITMSQLYNLMK